MKKILLAAMLISAAATTYAQVDITSEQVSSNPADAEFSAQTLGNKWNYEQTVNRKGYYRDVAEVYAGNSDVPTVLKSAAHRGIFAGIVGGAQLFDHNWSFGGGLELGWFGNHWGFSVTGTISNGYQDKTSMSQVQFKQYDAMGRLYWYPEFLQWCNHHLYVGPYAEFSYKFCRDYQEDGGTVVGTQTDGNGTTTTTTTTLMKLDNRASTMGWALGLRANYEFWGTPLRLHASVDYGRAQNLTFMRGMWHNRLKAEIGLSITLRRVQKNTKAMEQLGISPSSDLPRMW